MQQFDANGNCVIDDPEFFNAIDQWIAGQVSNELFFQVVDAWISQTDVCVGSSALKPELDGVELRATGRGMVFEARGQGIASISVEIFNLSGGRIFAREVPGTTLSWNLLTQEGWPLANGVYFYVVAVRDVLGQISYKVGKFALLR
jgi:hypothetical protein